MRFLTPLALAMAVLGLAGCAEYGASKEANLQNPDGFTAPSNGARQLRLDVFPGQPVDANGALRALPQTSEPVDANEQGVVDVGTLALLAPGAISGLVSGASVTPWADGATLPSSAGPVPATVTIARAGTVQQYTATTDDIGFYDAVVVPSETPYAVSVVPNDPTIPFQTVERGFRDGDEVVDFDIDYGVPLFGRVLTGNDEPVQNARVHAVDSRGVRSATARTDAAGWYMLRVVPDEHYHVVCTGRDHGRDPVLASTFTLAQPDTGTQVDFQYPNLAGSFATGRVIDSAGFAVPGVTVRFTATSLTDYEALDASLALEDVTDANGNFEASLLDGTYDVAFLPPDETDPDLDHAALVLEGRRTDSGGLIFGNQTLADLTVFEGSVEDPFGSPVARALLTCHEIGLGGRSWSTYTGPNGGFDFQVPEAPLSCVVQPPADRAGQFARTTEEVDVAIDQGHTFEIREGTLVRGVVELGGTGEPYALVEVRDGNGTVLGSAVTAGEGGDRQVGTFQVRVDIPN